MVGVSGQFESLQPGGASLEGSLMYQSRKSCRLLSRTPLHRKRCSLQLQGSLSGCSPTTTSAPFLTAPTRSHCVIGVPVFGPCSALDCEELWPPADPFYGVPLRSGHVCSFQIHEKDGTRPPPLPGHSFSDRNPFVLGDARLPRVSRTTGDLILECQSHLGAGVAELWAVHNALLHGTIGHIEVGTFWRTNRK